MLLQINHYLIILHDFDFVLYISYDHGQLFNQAMGGSGEHSDEKYVRYLEKLYLPETIKHKYNVLIISFSFVCKIVCKGMG